MDYTNLFYVIVYVGGSSHSIKDNEIAGHSEKHGTEYTYKVFPVNKVTDEAAEVALCFGGNVAEDVAEAYENLLKKNTLYSSKEEAEKEVIKILTSYNYSIN